MITIFNSWFRNEHFRFRNTALSLRIPITQTFLIFSITREVIWSTQTFLLQARPIFVFKVISFYIILETIFHNHVVSKEFNSTSIYTVRLGTLVYLVNFCSNLMQKRQIVNELNLSTH